LRVEAQGVRRILRRCFWQVELMPLLRQVFFTLA
jgi:hypothetical protein